jgi:hypothetical protein
MIKTGIIGAAALAVAAFATPSMAQEVISNPGYCAQFYPNANCQNKGPGNPYTGSRGHAAYGQEQGWGSSYNSWNDGRSGFWPADAAVGVVGGAVGTAGAIATAPFRTGYAQRNGFVCTPGTWFRGEDGRRHMCQ